MAEKLDATRIVAYLTEIMAGDCTITEEQMTDERFDEEAREVLAGLKFLHEDLQFRETERTRAESDLRATARELSQQNVRLEHSQSELAEIVEQLSTVVITVWDRVIMLPVIGDVDIRRAQRMTERLLERIVRDKARFVILDVTGVPQIETHTADHFVKIAEAVEMLGAKCFVAGIQPAVSATLANLGVDLSKLRTTRDCRGALRMCISEAG